MNLYVLLDVSINLKLCGNKKTNRLIKNTAINLVSAEHLIGLKTYTNRLQDKNDAILLFKLLNIK